MPKSNFLTVALIRACAVLAVVCAVQLPAAAEPKASGRLADGRAYRVDENGYQLVDHIAELEVGNDDLRRQLATLEAELAAKGGGATRVSPGSGDEIPNCNELVSTLYLKISRLEKQAADPTRLPAARSACDFESPQNPLWNQIRTLEQRLAETGSQQTACDFQSEQNPLWEQVRSLQAELNGSGGGVQHAAAGARARLDAPAPVRQERKAPADGPVRAEKRELQAKLRGIEELITARKSAYDRLKQQGSTVTVSISPLRTVSGLSLDTLRSRIASLGPQSNPAEIQRGLQEIDTLLKEDLKVLQRLLKL